jgi:serine/threonine protein kinase/outer membrane protein assembly factor BamB
MSERTYIRLFQSRVCNLMSDKERHPKIPDEVILGSSLSFGYNDIEKKDKIGAGGGVDIYEGRISVDDDSHRIVLKEPRFEGTIQTDVFERFEEEAETWFNLDRNRNIVSVHAYDIDPLPWIAVEYMDGGNLTDRIADSDTTEALWMAGRIAEGIHYGHRHGIAHLHLSPNNILFRETPEGKWAYPKVSDWGIAQLLYEYSNGEDGLVSEYAAPEQLDSEEYGTPDEITDTYQFGAIVYELLTGQPPFTGSATDVMQSILQEEPPAPTEINPELPHQIDEVLLTALEKEKSDRYESMVLFRRELDRLFDEHTDEKFGLSGSNGSSSTRTETTAESTTDSSSDTEAGSTDTSSSVLSRRAAVGMLGVGIIGGGAYVVTQSDTKPGCCDPPPEPTPPLSPKWEELLWGGFATGDTFIAENPTPSGGAIAFVTPDGEQTYVTQSIGTGYSLQTFQGNAVARNSNFVFASGDAVGSDARVAAFGREGEVGTRQWIHETPTEKRTYIPHIAADEKRVYYTAKGDRAPAVRALNIENGESVWEIVFNDKSITGISLYDSTLVVGNSGSIKLINPKTGESEDRIDLPPIQTSRNATIDNGFRNLTLTGDELYTVGEGIASYDLSSLEKQWAVDINREAKTLIETDERALYVGTGEGYLTAYSLTDGTKLWETQAEHNIDSRPAAANGLVWVVDSVGNLTGFDSTTGENVYTGMDLLRPGERAQVAALGSTVLLCVLYANDNVGQAYDVDVDALLE